MKQLETPERQPHSKDKARLLLAILDDVTDYVTSLQEQGVTQIECCGISDAPLSPDNGLDRIADQVAACVKCALHETRMKVVPGQGDPHPDILFVGEGPGREEDEQGLAFVGRAGQLLTRIIEAMGYRRPDVFIANIVKCRPPGNRKPLPDEMEACLPYLRAQIASLQPRAIVALGATALEGLVGPPVSITRQRGTWMAFDGIPLMPTFHPSYLLRTPSAKKYVWEDMKAVLKHLGREPTPRKREQ